MNKNEFTLVSPIFIANSILKISKEKNIKINPTKLNNLIYLVYLDFLYHTQTKLFNEQFSDSHKGPVLPSVYFKFSIWGNEHIKEYAKDAKGQIFIVNFKVLDAIISVNLELYGDMPEEKLIKIAEQRKNIKQNSNNLEVQKRYMKNQNVEVKQLQMKK